MFVVSCMCIRNPDFIILVFLRQVFSLILAVLELTQKTRLASNSEIFLFLLPGAAIERVCHHSWPNLLHF